jgi:hypothetical protein
MATGTTTGCVATTSGAKLGARAQAVATAGRYLTFQLDREEFGIGAPGNFHMMVSRRDGMCRAVVRDGPRVHHQRPSVDVLFQSVVEARMPHVVGVLLTGIGSDGAQGLLKLRQAGAWTIAQDEPSCVVYGMPKAADLGAAQQVTPLSKVCGAILTALAAGSVPRPVVGGPLTIQRRTRLRSARQTPKSRDPTSGRRREHLRNPDGGSSCARISARRFQTTMASAA